MPLVDSCSVTSSGRPSSASSTVLAGDRQIVADLGPLVQRAPQGDHVVEQVVRFVAQGVECPGSEW